VDDHRSVFRQKRKKMNSNCIRTVTFAFWMASLSIFVAPLVRADAEIGKAAPDFSVVDSTGKKHALRDYAGKIVVLEWLNFECPFVKKHYSAGNMQKLQADAKKEGAVWLSVVSSAPGKQGFYEPKEMEARRKKEKGNQAAILLDSDGKIGKAYGAKNTPHMFVIDAKGMVAYQGAIDSIDTAESEDIAKATNYVSAAIADLKAGRKVAISDTKPYGCGVKYAK
jgi:peroxiredoxin